MTDILKNTRDEFSTEVDSLLGELVQLEKELADHQKTLAAVNQLIEVEEDATKLLTYENERDEVQGLIDVLLNGDGSTAFSSGKIIDIKRRLNVISEIRGTRMSDEQVQSYIDDMAAQADRSNAELQELHKSYQDSREKFPDVTKVSQVPTTGGTLSTNSRGEKEFWGGKPYLVKMAGLDSARKRERIDFYVDAENVSDDAVLDLNARIARAVKHDTQYIPFAKNEVNAWVKSLFRSEFVEDGKVLVGYGSFQGRDENGLAIVRVYRIFNYEIFFPQNGMKAKLATGLSCYTLAKFIPIPYKYAQRNFRYTGRVGSGKTVGMAELEHQVCNEQGVSAVFWSKTGEEIERFYRPGIDLIANPFDSRCPGYDFFDSEDPVEYQQRAYALIPENANGGEGTYFSSLARLVIANVMHQLKMRANATGRPAWATLRTLNAVLFNQNKENVRYELGLNPDGTDPNELSTIKQLRSEDKTSIESLVRGTAAQGVFRDDKQKNLAMTNITQQLSILQFLQDPKPGQKGISPYTIIREMMDDNNPSGRRLFLGSNEKIHDVVTPIHRMILSACFKTAMSGSKVDYDKIWFFMDELSSLGTLFSFKEVISEGRKFGICIVVGYQVLSQVKETQGENDSRTINANLSNRICFNIPDQESAKFFSEELGKKIIEVGDAASISIKEGVGSYNVRSAIDDKKAAVPPERIQALKDCECIIKIGGFNPAEAQYQPVDYPTEFEGLINQPFEPLSDQQMNELLGLAREILSTTKSIHSAATKAEQIQTSRLQEIESSKIINRAVKKKESSEQSAEKSVADPTDYTSGIPDFD
jgi:hypothetical protein